MALANDLTLIVRRYGLPPASIGRSAESNSATDLVDSYRVLDYDFRLQTKLPGVATLVGDLLSPFRTDSTADAAIYEVVDSHQPWSRFAVYLLGRPIREHGSLEPVLEYLFWHINAEAIASVTGRLVLHASAASWGGQGVLMPAPMGSGKSTLVAGLTAAGFSYLTDEAAPLDPTTCLLHPYPKPIWLDHGSVEALSRSLTSLSSTWTRRLADRYHVLPEELSLVTTGTPCRVGYVIIPRYQSGSTTRLQPISRAQALFSLAQSSFNFRSFGGAGLALLHTVVSGAQCYGLLMGDLASAVRSVEEVVGALHTSQYQIDRRAPTRGPSRSMRGAAWATWPPPSSVDRSNR